MNWAIEIFGNWVDDGDFQHRVITTPNEGMKLFTREKATGEMVWNYYPKDTAHHFGVKDERWDKYTKSNISKFKESNDF